MSKDDLNVPLNQRGTLFSLEELCLPSFAVHLSRLDDSSLRPCHCPSQVSSGCVLRVIFSVNTSLILNDFSYKNHILIPGPIVCILTYSRT